MGNRVHLDNDLAHTFDEFEHLEAKNYRAHHLNIIIGYLEHLDHGLESPWDLNAKNYGAHHLEFIIGHPIDLDHEYNVKNFRRILKNNKIKDWFHNVGKSSYIKREMGMKRQPYALTRQPYCLAKNIIG